MYKKINKRIFKLLRRGQTVWVKFEGIFFTVFYKENFSAKNPSSNLTVMKKFEKFLRKKSLPQGKYTFNFHKLFEL